MAASFRPDIEGMRALAVAGVVAYHFGLTALPGGFAGVDIFFVISGYLITRHLLQEIGESGRLNLWRFYARRARRLLPASLFVILATLLAGAFILSPEEQALYSKGAMFASAYMINLWLIRWSFDYFASDAANNPFIHFWSLSVEEQFYLAWPALLVLAAWLRPGRRAAIVVIGVTGLVSFVACAWLTSVSPPWAFYFSPLRAWEFAAGGLATMVPASFLRCHPRLRAAQGWLGLALIVPAYLLLDEALPFPGLLALLPVVGTVLLLVSGAGERQADGKLAGGPAALLSLPPMQWIGKLSYSLYLWHWPVIVYAGMVTAELSGLDRFACLALTLMLSIFTYHVIENPVRRNGWLMASAARALVPAALLTGAGVVAAYANAKFAVHELDPEQRVIAQSAARPSTARARGGCVLDYETITPKPCVFGAKNVKGTIALFGDSHADHWSTPLIQAAEKRDYRVVTWLKSSCRASRLSTWSSKLKRDYAECDQWREQSIKEILALRPALVVISEIALTSSRKMAAGKDEPDSQDAEWKAGLRSTLETFSKAGLKVAFIRDVPFNDEQVDTCVARALWRGDTPSLCDQTRAYAANDAMAAVERDVVRSIPNARYVDMTDQFCNQTTCHVFIGGKIAFRDRHHLATAFAETLEKPLEKALF
ncbi:MULTISPECIES: acyltransferase family protein [unclassified Mesorhizobium]|uniref:acyltransferase family protein n=1 Tax=unclassified Mesorhizobium TaxID=325217 RepID=UPI00112A3F6B|nr:MULTISPECIES: acyltransferase family protein [unclassified Mesorhizobium]MBZ9953888.1 acyltransferase [Mesorhizobium sp. BR1-1-15]MBZ9973641.1 acyltransferase [Mesorhizobium sp. BR1-1-12]TPM23202.1 acyltransferase [Mesorhizobium sp. B2-3-6]TPM98850.1 acyltransferase [Mesorhizobium sp. B2-1-5]TPN67286.1 acyltransferase [Mesorhizobium sp. B1-1-1]